MHAMLQVWLLIGQAERAAPCSLQHDAQCQLILMMVSICRYYLQLGVQCRLIAIYLELLVQPNDAAFSSCMAQGTRRWGNYG